MGLIGAQASGEKHRLEVPGLAYAIELPYVCIPKEGRHLRIASLNLLGQTRLNRDLGRLLARRIRSQLPDLAGIVFLTVVDKALMLTQAVARNSPLMPWPWRTIGSNRTWSRSGVP